MYVNIMCCKKEEGFTDGIVMKGLIVGVIVIRTTSHWLRTCEDHFCQNVRFLFRFFFSGPKTRKSADEGGKTVMWTVKFDDDDTRKPGWKFAEHELKGVPLRVA